jgi:hypothetical protein
MWNMWFFTVGQFCLDKVPLTAELADLQGGCINM